MEHRFPSKGLQLAAHLARPPARADATAVPAVVLAHGYPSSIGSAASAAHTMPELADRIASEMGWMALAVAFRGCDESEGDFSLAGWRDDLLAGVDHLSAMPEVSAVWVAGFGTGGALAVIAGAQDRRVRGVAALAAPADFDDWASHPRRLLEHSRRVGLISDRSHPADFDAWAAELKALRAVAAAPRLAPRSLLVAHGSEDDLVPVFDARVLADAHGQAELRIINGAGHTLRHDPRAVAMLLGWLARQLNRPSGREVPLP
ncbi:MAG: alpha/beta hydrolase family protein [Acidimicrobiia bacterium]